MPFGIQDSLDYYAVVVPPKFEICRGLWNAKRYGSKHSNRAQQFWTSAAEGRYYRFARFDCHSFALS